MENCLCGAKCGTPESSGSHRRSPVANLRETFANLQPSHQDLSIDTLWTTSTSRLSINDSGTMCPRNVHCVHKCTLSDARPLRWAPPPWPEAADCSGAHSGMWNARPTYQTTHATRGAPSGGVSFPPDPRAVSGSPSEILWRRSRGRGESTNQRRTVRRGWAERCSALPLAMIDSHTLIHVRLDVCTAGHNFICGASSGRAADERSVGRITARSYGADDAVGAGPAHEQQCGGDTTAAPSVAARSSGSQAACEHARLRPTRELCARRARV